MNREFWKDVETVIRKADIILMVIDSRLPKESINEEIKWRVERQGKKLVYVFNKIDLVGRKDLDELRKQYDDAFFVSGARNIGISGLKKGIFVITRRMGIELPHVGIVGYPNVGKSAIINALSHRAKAKVSSVAGTTRGVQWVKAGTLRIIDSPGVIPLGDKEQEIGVLGAKNPEMLRNPDSAALKVIQMFLEKDKRKLENYFGIKINDKSDEEILEMIGKKRGFLIKGGNVDIDRTVIQILRDWQKGKLRL